MLLKAAEFLTKIVKKGCPQPGFEPGAFQKAKKVSFFCSFPTEPRRHYILHNQNIVSRFLSNKLCIIDMERDFNVTHIRLKIYKRHIF